MKRRDRLKGRGRVEERGSGGVGQGEGLRAQYIFHQRNIKTLRRGPSVSSQCGRYKDVVAVGVKHVQGSGPTDSQVSKVVAICSLHSTLML